MLTKNTGAEITQQGTLSGDNTVLDSLMSGVSVS